MMKDPAEIDAPENVDPNTGGETRTERVDCTVEIEGVAAGGKAGGFV